MGLEIQKKEFTAVALDRYIAQHYGGNQAGFARKTGITRQAVGDLIKRGAMVGNGMIYTPARTI
jgi:hypothetical protein